MRILLLLIALLVPRSVVAETLTIGGRLDMFTLPAGAVGTLDLSGDYGFEYPAVLFADLFTPPVMTCGHTRNTCLPGDVVSAHLLKSASDLRGAFWLEGITYTVAPDGPLFLYRNFVMIDLRGTGILPNESTLQPLTFSFPFTYTVNVLRQGLETFTATGEGNVTVRYASLTYPLTQGPDPVFASGWTVNSASYIFATLPDSTVVPEPSTLVLIGSGLVAWHQRRHREQHARRK